MKITKIEFEQLLDKIVSSLTTHFNDPKVIDYNFYNNASGVGVKMVRKGKKMTIEDLALEMRAGFAKQEEFNQEVRDFMRDQKIFNKKQEEFNNRIEQDIEILKKDVQDIKNCPTIKRELQ